MSQISTQQLSDSIKKSWVYGETRKGKIISEILRKTSNFGSSELWDSQKISQTLSVRVNAWKSTFGFVEIYFNWKFFEQF